jgi:prepilin-type N-terminal cleavage/methylation domain-containing protein
MTNDFSRLREPDNCASVNFKGPFVIRNSSFARAFTLIEIMVVVAIMGIILAAGIPSLYGFFHKSGFRKTMGDILETCQSARSKAIMTGTYAELVIHPREGRLEVSGDAPRSGYGTWAHSAKIEGARLYALRINNSDKDLTEFEEVRVRFYPDGKCEEMTLLLEPNDGGMRGISLEITTGLPKILTDADIRALRSR